MPWWDTAGNAQNDGTPFRAKDQRLDIYHHVVQKDLSSVIARLDKFEALLTGLILQGNKLMATTQEVLDKVNAVAAAVAPLGAAIDALEAAVASAGGLTAADQANLDAALAALNGVEAAVVAAVTDATNGPDAVAEPAGIALSE